MSEYLIGWIILIFIIRMQVQRDYSNLGGFPHKFSDGKAGVVHFPGVSIGKYPTTTCNETPWSTTYPIYC